MELYALLSHFNGVKKSGDQYMALCPAHDDHNPSLSIGLSKDGKRILLHCFAGCHEEEILQKVGVTMKDLCLDPDHSAKNEIRKQTYDYADTNGSLLYRKTRIDYDDGTKSFYFNQPDGTKGVKGIQRVPYNLPNVLKAQTVYFVEGEKCADAINKEGRTATTLDSGSNSQWLPEYNSYFDGKTVIIIPDNDEPGKKYAHLIAGKIPGSKIVNLPGLAEKEDIYDWLQAGHTMDEVDNLPYAPEEILKKEKSPKLTQAEQLFELIERSEAKLFRNQINDPFVVFSKDGHKEVWAIGSSDFKSWLHQLFYDETGKPAKKDTITQVTDVLTAKARFSRDDAIPLSTRVAEKDSVFWYDLTNQEWQAIKITADGWDLVNNPPLLFCRYRHQKPQEQPKRGGDINLIFKYVNLNENIQILFLCWLVSSFVPNIPHPMLIFFGEKGASKSTTAIFLKELIDPSVLDTLSIPNLSSLLINLSQHWFLDFDNISHINEEVSDILCRAITGGGIQQRKLFTDAEDVIFRFQRCISINGINNVATRSDLLDRSILMELDRIPEEKRRELKEIQSEFKKDLASILGGILDTLSKAMAIFPTIKR